METFANFTAISTLAGGIDSSETTLTVADGSGFETGGNLRILIDDELLLVTDVVGDVLTVTRGIENTTPASHANGADVNPVFTAGGLNQALSEVGSGDVIGPSSSGDSKVVLFDGTDGKKIKDSGLSLSGNNTGDQTSIVGITGSLAEFNTALTGADFATGGGTVSGASSGTNTGDQDISGLASTSSVNAALALKANLASPTFTGTPAAPTASQANNSTQLATTAYVDTLGATKVTGPASSTDLAISIYNGTGGKTIKNSLATIDSSGNITANSFVGQLVGNIMANATFSTGSSAFGIVPTIYAGTVASSFSKALSPSGSVADGTIMGIRLVSLTAGQTLTITPDGSDVIRHCGASLTGMILDKQDAEIWLRKRSSGWDVVFLRGRQTQEIFMHTPSGQGSSSTKIRFLTVTKTQVGTAIGITSNSTVGSTFPITEWGNYLCERSDGNTGAACNGGFSLDSNQLTTSFSLITEAHRTGVQFFATSNGNGPHAGNVVCQVGQTIRPHDGGTSPNFTTAGSFVHITKMGE